MTPVTRVKGLLVELKFVGEEMEFCIFANYLYVVDVTTERNSGCWG